MERRKHHKLAEFPPELVGAVNDLLQKGATYAEVTAYLVDRGAAIGKSSVARYAKEFQARLDRLGVVKDRLRAIQEEVGGDALMMQDATTQLALHQVAEHLLKLDSLGDVNPVQLMKALALLNSSSVQVRKYQEEQRKKAQEAASQVKDVAKKAGLSEDAIREIEEKVLGIAA